MPTLPQRISRFVKKSALSGEATGTMGLIDESIARNPQAKSDLEAAKGELRSTLNKTVGAEDEPQQRKSLIPAARDPRAAAPAGGGKADLLAMARGVDVEALEAKHKAELAAAVADAEARGAKGQRAVQERDKQAEEIQKAEARKNAKFLSQRELAKYNNSVKWASEGMTPDQIFRKHKSTTYTQPDNVPADVSNLPSTFLDDNNYTLTPPKGRSGEMPRLGEGLTPPDQWNKLFPNRDVPAAAPAPVRQPPGAQAMRAVVPEWNQLPNEHPDDLRARRADLIRQQLGIDTAPGWHLPQAPGSTDLLGTKFTSNPAGTQRQIAGPYGNGSSTGVVPSLPGMMPPPVKDVQMPPIGDRGPDGTKPLPNPDPTAAQPDISYLNLPQ